MIALTVCNSSFAHKLLEECRPLCAYVAIEQQEKCIRACYEALQKKGAYAAQKRCTMHYYPLLAKACGLVENDPTGDNASKFNSCQVAQAKVEKRPLAKLFFKWRHCLMRASQQQRMVSFKKDDR